MTPEEAIVVFDKMLKRYAWAEDNKSVQAIKVAKECIEKQIGKKPATNFDRIKAMSVEEMADMLQENIHTCDFCIKKDADCREEHCKDNIKKWLESEVEEE